MSTTKEFHWPHGYRAALSFTFDDARLSQPRVALPILDAHGVKATFYVSPSLMEARLPAWRAAVENGHEIGNHTVTHPCTGNFKFSRKNPLEDFTLERMERDEILAANAIIQKQLGVTPETFAYPCGQYFVGRGEHHRSFVPLIARHFVAGRGYLGESANDPSFCDLANVLASGADGASFEQLKTLLDAALKEGSWLILVAHEVGKGGFQMMRADALEQLCVYANDPLHGLWVGTVAAVGKYLKGCRV